MAGGSGSRLLPSHTESCYGCGTDNACGFHLQVWRTGDEIHTDVAFDARHVGGPGLAHGGAISTVCDELLGFTVWLVGAPIVTRALTVDYLSPVRLHDPHRITARIDGQKGRAVFVRAEGVAGDGVVSFTASGVYVRVAFEHFEKFAALRKSATELSDELDRGGR
jgi:acyl-coenzyme A thioesterase PaaI-like protein